ncbi:dihydroorotate dehydrogenase [Nocardioides guangzhouensis]|uniref:Dihydroorotate dehydrogenase n=1 Tax=Nocardioides guangzhouensis TaxID=2497878 RepID=A0A4Q4ZFA0_9ACTN|nr:nitronate monooxygenase [Nocardioides guangzhouensis]RYP86071.1 dihydroorotate dehydrogenase [Nocardioides guangzhouensis]
MTATAPEVAIAGLALASPVLVAAGCGGTGRELAALDGLTGVGGFVTRTITLDPREGHPGRRVHETDAGFVHATGLANPGLHQFLATELPWLAAADVRTVVSVAASSLGEYADLARRLGDSPGVDGLELDLATPDGPALGLFDTREPFQAARAVAAVRRDLPRGTALLAKVGHDPLRVVETARAVAEAGADAVVLGNALPALLPDGRPGGLSGPAVRPVALRTVAEVHAALPGLPLVGAGGAAGADHVRAFLAAGATAVQIGAALLHDPTCAARAAADLRGET